MIRSVTHLDPAWPVQSGCGLACRVLTRVERTVHALLPKTGSQKTFSAQPEGVSPEWRLVKSLKFAGAAVPTAVAMREFDKFPAWTIEQ